jgi:hypothetical protein
MLYEQLVFLPNSVRNSEVALRFAYNGVHQEALSEIVKDGRILPKDTGCTINTALKIMQHGHRFRFGHESNPRDNWTPKKAFDNEIPDGWNNKNLSWNGCHLDVEYVPGSGPVVDGVPFESLAKGVSKMRTGYDALDLTRCVELAQRNLGVYDFPHDFPNMVQQMGGPVPVRYGHLDAAVARRYTKKSVIFKRRLKAGLITEPDDKLVVRTVPSSNNIGNGSPNSNAADEVSSNDSTLALRTEQYIELTTLQMSVSPQIADLPRPRSCCP